MVAIDEVQSKHVLLTIDDGSGATIVVKITLESKDTSSAVNTLSSTKVPNVYVRTSIGLLNVLINNVIVDIGTVLKVKAMVERFRGSNQLAAERLEVIEGTTGEARVWGDIARWKTDILAQPWILSKDDLKRLEARVRAKSMGT